MNATQNPPLNVQDNVSLNYQVDGKGDITILFFNGAASPLQTWDAVVDLLKADFRLIRFDQRNAGQTGFEGAFSLLDTARDAAAVLNNLNVKKAVVVGHAWGGRAAQVFARDYPHLVSKLVICGTGGQLPADDPDKLMSVIVDSRKNGDKETWQNAIASLFCAAGFRDRDPAAFAKACAVIWPRSETARGRWDPTIAPSHSYWGMATMPALLIYGAEDKQGTPANALHLAARLNQSRLEMIPGAGHFVICEQPQWVAQLIRDFATSDIDSV